MQIPDVNVLIDAWRPRAPQHDRARQWLEDATTGQDVGLPDVVMTGAARILTMQVKGLWFELSDVLTSVESLRADSRVSTIQPGRRHWQIFTDLCRQTNAIGNKVPDCYLAAFAIEREATLVSRDRFFEQVPGLSWSDLP